MADGSGVPFEHVYLTSLAKEILNVLRMESQSAGSAHQQAEPPAGDGLQTSSATVAPESDEAKSDGGRQSAGVWA